MTHLVIDADTLRPLIAEVVQQTLAQFNQISAGGEPRLSWREDEAAKLLGLQPHQLRDRRLDGEVTAKKVGRSWYYTREELLRLVSNSERGGQP